MKKQAIHTVHFKDETDTQELELDLGGPELTTIEIAPMNWHIENDSYSDGYGVVPRFQPVVDKVMVIRVNGESSPFVMEMGTRLINAMKRAGELDFTIGRINE